MQWIHHSLLEIIFIFDNLHNLRVLITIEQFFMPDMLLESDVFYVR